MKFRSALRPLSLTLAVLLSACQATVPAIQTAEVQVHNKTQNLENYPLSSEQVSELNAWLQARRNGWSTSVASYAPKLIVRAKHSDGTESVVNVLDASVVVYSTSPTLTKQVTRSLTTAEQQALQGILQRQ